MFSNKRTISDSTGQPAFRNVCRTVNGTHVAQSDPTALPSLATISFGEVRIKVTRTTSGGEGRALSVQNGAPFGEPSSMCVGKVRISGFFIAQTTRSELSNYRISINSRLPAGDHGAGPATHRWVREQPRQREGVECERERRSGKRFNTQLMVWLCVHHMQPPGLVLFCATRCP